MKDIQVRLMRAGASGKDAWTPVIAIVPDGFRLVMQITNWVGGEGEKPVTGLYIGPSGYVDEIAKAVDVRGVGQKGWSPVLSVIPDGERRLLQVFDWTGGEGEKPVTGLYIGLNGLVDDISAAMDIRGAQGIQGGQGEKGDTGNMGPMGPIPDHKWAGTSLAFQKIDGTYETPVNLIGPQGAQGVQGQQGIQGPTGSPTTPDSITNEFLANIPANTIKGRLATDGDPQDLTVDEAWELIGAAGKATQEQAEAGTDDVQFMTALQTVNAIKAQFQSSLGNFGWLMFPKRWSDEKRLILQWGTVRCVSTGAKRFFFPVKFPDAPFSFSVSVRASQANLVVCHQVADLNAEAFNMFTTYTDGNNVFIGNNDVHYIALGY